jgi:hypothetical protein
MFLVDPWKEWPEGSRIFTTGQTEARMKQRGYDKAFATTVKRLHFALHRVIILRTVSAEAHSIIASVLREWGVQLDFVFIDAEHGYEAVREECRWFWPLLRSGGLLCGHDYHIFDGVKQAVDEFAELERRELKHAGSGGKFSKIWNIIR